MRSILHEKAVNKKNIYHNVFTFFLKIEINIKTIYKNQFI